MPGYYSDLQFDNEYRSLPDKIDEEALERNVAALRLGDMTQVPLISVKLLRFTMALVANHAHSRRTPDLIGTALLTLVETVAFAATRLEDNNILPFVSSHVSHRLKDFIASDHVVCIPARTLRRWRRNGIEAFIPVSSARFHEHEVAARPESPSLECTEMLQKIIRCDRDRAYIQMRAEGNGLQVIADAVGVSVGLVHKWKQELRERFSELNDA